MSDKHKNPYRQGSQYHGVFQHWMSTLKGIATRAQLFEHARSLKMTEGCAMSIVNIMLSPRDHKLAGKIRGKVRGNPCSRGAFYFAEPLHKEMGETKRFRLRWREPAVVASMQAEDKRARKAARQAAQQPELPVVVEQTATKVTAPVAPETVPS